MARFNERDASYVWQGEDVTGNKQMYVQHLGDEVHILSRVTSWGKLPLKFRLRVWLF